MIDETFIVVGALLTLGASLGYLRDTVQGKVQPNRVSWFLWTAAPLIAFSAELHHGVGLPALLTFTMGFGPLLIFIGSFFNRNASWKLTKLDVICGIFALFGLILWQATGSGNIAILFSILADGMAAIPTIVKSYKDPESEKWYVYFFWAVSAALTLLALDHWSFAHAGFALYIFGLGMLFATLIKFKLGTWSSRLKKSLQAVID